MEDQAEENTITDVNTPLNWQAQEYEMSDRGSGWYVVFALIVLGFIAIDIFLLKSWTFSVLVVVMAVALIVYIKRPIKTVDYALSVKQGIYVADKLYHFDDFRAFGVINDAGKNSIMLLPRKRFSPGVSVYFPDEIGEQLVDILGKRLPMEDLKLDFIDILIRKLRL